MLTSLVRSSIASALMVAAAASAQQTPARWAVDPTPMLTLGESQADTNDMFAQVVGATRLPDGRVLVGDVGSYALRLFSADGKLVRRFGRKGAGPGEIGYLNALLRCGDSVVTLDVDKRTSVFSLGGQYVRVFRFSSPQDGRSSYRSACNDHGDFVHYGWERRTDAKNGAYRPIVPLWVSGTDSVTRPSIATIPGSERYGLVIDSQISTRPLPLGKQSAIAIGTDRVYVATGDTYEIAVYDFAGKPRPSIRDSRPVQPTTRADIDHLKALATAMATPSRQAAIERDLDALPLPKTLPAYTALLVDRAGLVWAQEYPRGTSAMATWTVFDVGTRRVATIGLPTHLEVYEIGDDYVLGRFLDPDEAVPQVRLYRLRRGR